MTNCGGACILMVDSTCSAQEVQNHIAKLKTKCWDRTHKFGVKIPKSVAGAKALRLVAAASG
jgi:hypothetical protein